MLLNQIVPWGRRLDEYRLLFDLTEADLNLRLLGCGDGPASFNAEMHALGKRVISCDPIYAHPLKNIEERFEATSCTIMDQVGKAPRDYVWNYHRNPEALLACRRSALKLFANDFACGVSEGRYLVAQLPELPFLDRTFDIALCSHLLFLYSDQFDFEFHYCAAREMIRVAGEARIFPLTTLRCEISPYLKPVMERLNLDGYETEIVKTNYQLQRNGDSFLRVKNPGEKL